jgi:hypothetical protein
MFGVTKVVTADEDERDYPAPKFQPRNLKPKLGYTLVQDFVIFAHSELDMVKKLLEKQPALINATVDWGAGDWESALGGAAHMGRRDITEFLLEHGARIDIFAAAMLGQLETVKTLLAAYPKLIDAKGPHGITLKAHAKVGGKPAADVLVFLEAQKPSAESAPGKQP